MSRRSFAAAALTLVALMCLSVGCTKLGTGGGHGNKWSDVTYAVSGSGQADVAYARSGTSQLTTRRAVHLPFSETVQIIDHSQTIYRVTAKDATGPLHCKITVNGVVVYQQSAPAGQPVTCSFVK
ncbi:MAG TPA: MmpS family transport accessory protein [Marmoricola sp.]